MTKWFEEVANDASNIVSSRVRLSRNWEEYKFPSRLEPDEARTMIARLKQNFRDLGDRDGQFYEYEDLELMEKLDRTALRERRLLNRTLAEKTTPGGILCSEDERVSMVLNADDHIRLQVLASGLDLQECYAKADALDDYINEKIPYAFNEKYGYLTSYPTNVGTAMKASVVVHLPSLTMNKKFQELLGDMGRFGTTVRGVYGRGNENYGDLYEVVNQKTLGITEQEILELVANVAGQLSAQENQFREVSLSRHRLEREERRLKALAEKRVLTDPLAFVQDRRLQLDYMQDKMTSAARTHWDREARRFAGTVAKLDALSPLKVLGRGYAMARTEDGGILRSSDQVQPGDRIRLRLAQGSLGCRVEEKEDNHGEKEL